MIAPKAAWSALRNETWVPSLLKRKPVELLAVKEIMVPLTVHMASFEATWHASVAKDKSQGLHERSGTFEIPQLTHVAGTQGDGESKKLARHAENHTTNIAKRMVASGGPCEPHPHLVAIATRQAKKKVKETVRGLGFAHLEGLQITLRGKSVAAWKTEIPFIQCVFDIEGEQHIGWLDNAHRPVRGTFRFANDELSIFLLGAIAFLALALVARGYAAWGIPIVVILLGIMVWGRIFAHRNLPSKSRENNESTLSNSISKSFMISKKDEDIKQAHRYQEDSNVRDE